MSRFMQQNDQLLKWAESGQLDAGQLRLLEQQAALAPTAQQWRRALDALLAVAGVVLLGVGTVFFFAWNWDDLHRFAKLALALAALTGFAGLAGCSRPATVQFRAALLGAAICTGALLALIGQTYQTGADIWQLFFAWSVLIIPWALLSRSAACWALCWVVANLAILRFFATTSWLGMFGSLGSPHALQLIALFNLLVLLAFECLGSRLLEHDNRVMQRLGTVGLLMPLTLGGLFTWWDLDYLTLLLIFLGVSAVGVGMYWRWRRDLLSLALLLFSLIAVSVGGLSRALEGLDYFLLLNAVGGYLLLASALASIWLHRLSREAGV